MKCGGWDLVEPDHGKIKCSFVGPTADTGEVCKLECEKFYKPDVSHFRCMASGGWDPTANPNCQSTRNLTMIVVPSVVGSIFFLIVTVVICCKCSERWRKTTRFPRFDDGDLERGIPPGKRQAYMVRTSKRPGAEKKAEDTSEDERESEVCEQVGSTNASKPERRRGKQSLSQRWKKMTFRKRFTKRFRNRTKVARTFVRRGICSIKSPWKQNSRGPKRIVGRSSGVGECGGIQPPARSWSSCSSSSSYCTDSNCSCRSMHETVKCEEKIFLSSSTSKKLPPPRPPAPIHSTRKLSLETKAKILNAVGAEMLQQKKKNVSSGYSSKENHHKRKRNNEARKKKRKKSKLKVAKQETKKEGVSEGNRQNPFNNYPVSAADRQYEDLEHDYRKNGHIYDGGIHYPQYQHVKSYPMKPVHKQFKDKYCESDKEEVNKNNKTQPVSTGGVKYYSIKPDKDEIKELKKRKKRESRSKSAKRKEKRKHFGRIEKHRNKESEYWEMRKRKHSENKPSKKGTRSKSEKKSRNNRRR